DRPAREQLSITVDERVKVKLTDIAARRRQSVTQFANVIIEDWLNGSLKLVFFTWKNIRWENEV
ncbi:MAG: hypothetical protein QQN63_08155, partial [Nitrosopumilus sp.]